MFMKKLLTILVLLFSVANLQAQSISNIETTKSWYYIYDQDGKKIKTISTSQGELKGYSSTFYIIKQGSGFYVTYDVSGKRLHTFGTNSVGEILGAAGEDTNYFLFFKHNYNISLAIQAQASASAEAANVLVF